MYRIIDVSYDLYQDTYDNVAIPYHFTPIRRGFSQQLQQK